MAADNESLEEKSKKVSEKKIGKGEEVQSFQEAQNQLQQLQAAQKENIQLNRAYSSAQAQQNDIMAQAAGIAASGDNTGPVQGRELQLNPQTQAILGKYGYGRPKTETSTSSNSGPVQGRGIIINNKTENKTTNNVNVSTPPTVVSKSGGDEGMSKFKTWISSSFARQKAQDAVRQREFDKKEWSLSRSSRRVMDKLEEVGKTIGENLDPRKVASIYMDQLKTLLFLLGFGLLAKNWKDILKGVASIEKWIRKQAEYFGITFKGGKLDFCEGKSQFTKDLIGFLGGDPEKDKSAFTALVELGKEGFDYLIGLFKILMKERVEALKLIKFPSGDSYSGGNEIVESVINGLKPLGEYLVDVFSCLFGGAAGASKAITRRIEKKGKEALASDGASWALNPVGQYESLGKIASKGGIDPNDSSLVGNNTDVGSAIALTDANVVGDQFYNEYGDLKDSTAATMVTSKAVEKHLQDTESSTASTPAVIAGLTLLKNAIDRDGKIAIKGGFIDTFSKYFGEDWASSEGVGTGEYKLVRRPKTVAEVKKEIEDKDTGIGKWAGLIAGIAAGGFLGSYAGHPIAGAAAGAWGGSELGQKLENAITELGIRRYTVDIRPANVPLRNSDERVIPFGGKQTFQANEISNIGFKALIKAIQEKIGTDAEFGSDKFIIALDNFIKSNINQGSVSDEEVEKLKDTELLSEKTQEEIKEHNKHYFDSDETRMGRFISNVKKIPEKLKNAISGLVKSGKSLVKRARELIGANEGTGGVYKDNDGNLAFGYGMHADTLRSLGAKGDLNKLTKEQLAQYVEKYIQKNEKSAIQSIGKETWDSLSDGQKIAIFDMMHNSGQFYRRIKDQLKAGNIDEAGKYLYHGMSSYTPTGKGGAQNDAAYRETWNNRAIKNIVLWYTDNNGNTDIKKVNAAIENMFDSLRADAIEKGKDTGDDSWIEYANGKEYKDIVINGQHYRKKYLTKNQFGIDVDLASSPTGDDSSTVSDNETGNLLPEVTIVGNKSKQKEEIPTTTVNTELAEGVKTDDVGVETPSITPSPKPKQFEYFTVSSNGKISYKNSGETWNLKTDKYLISINSGINGLRFDVNNLAQAMKNFAEIASETGTKTNIITNNVSSGGESSKTSEPGDVKNITS